ncbi:MAG: type II toxin-antitoxin system HicA family toxin [Brevibacterium aurantiacum]|uniref:type II toxin-antitoxin system HicA family toxin n=1 Tax=Brachybacterium alimentarium TaxID=47845 RepID=UPI002163180C|nr:type II toxin-antitoxin system HicA family toxin [Brachybacterium alimentarium]MDN6301466.1 type II toxin-antitoxin system HicA family toxin [Brachybacterium sp.]MDN6327854.1 type II toxin-antitoxin system HicA family toxin [Brachybacterium sp.]MDN6372318.1 type II toxin-antitoxin system HicA family toxin [Brevibacterium aurantiacum]
MAKEMKYRDLARLLRDAGFSPREGKGDHEVWSAPGFARHVVLTQTRTVSPGLVRKAQKAMAEKQKQKE